MFDVVVVPIPCAAGCAAAVHSWPPLRTRATGIAAEANRLRQRAAALEAERRGL